MKTVFVLLSLMMVAKGYSQTLEKDTLMLSELVISSKRIFQKGKNPNDFAGASVVLGKDDLMKFNYINPNKLLEGVSGVHLYEEDGFGLRPNISIRGTAAERSEKINLMEDGIPISPAPYSASAAYYFPNIARMEGVEILKGSGQIVYGPNTVGGSLNLLSKSVPKDLSAEVDVSAASFNTYNASAQVGGTFKNLGVLLSYLHQDSKGFKTLANNGDTGFRNNDFSAKFNYANEVFNAPYKVEFKYQYSDQDSHETYLGLSDEDFSLNPNRRYFASANDNIQSDHQQYVLSGHIQLKPNLQINVDAYYNAFARNWYKIEGVDAGNGRQSINNVLATTDEYASEYAALQFGFNGNNRLFLRNNNRTYLSKGLQANILWGFTTRSINHEFKIGSRLHYDEADRFQWEDEYTNANKELILLLENERGSQSNRIDFANAFSSYLQYHLDYKFLKLTAGLRYENVNLQRNDYGDNLARIANDVEQRSNRNEVFIPGVSFLFKANEQLNLFGGVHKGFSPSGSSEGQDAESSVNYELGLRYSKSTMFMEIIGFINDYSNLLGSDLNASGGAGNNELFNAGKITVKGIEARLNYLLNQNGNVKFPIGINYSYLKSSFSDDFDSTIYGQIERGDELPYIPNHQLRAEIGIHWNALKVALSYRYLGNRRTEVGQGAIPTPERVDGYNVVDISAQYQLKNNLTIYTTIENLFDNVYAVSRAPAGIRPGLPLFIRAGVRLSIFER